MSTLITDAATGKTAVVDNNNRLTTSSISESLSDSASNIGKRFNINTGNIMLTSGCESAVLYLKNNEDSDIVITSFIYNIGNAYDSCAQLLSGCHFVNVIRNPTQGDIITNATDVDAISNLNYGSNNILNANVFKGTEGDSFIDGDFSIGSIGNIRGRTVIALGAVHMPKGSSVGITVQPPFGTASMMINIAISIFLFSSDVSGES